MVLDLIVIVVCVIAVRYGLEAFAGMRSRVASVRAKSHWLWLGAAALVALGFAAYH